MFILHEVNEGLEMLSFLFKLSTIELTKCLYIYICQGWQFPQGAI